MNVLITGGAGYIGSFAAHRLLKEGCQVVVYDNMSTGFRESLNPACQFVFGDIRDRELPGRVMRDYKIDMVMHFAAKIIVPESLQMPMDYYENNFLGGLNLLRNCVKSGVKKFIFSSTAAVYGDPAKPKVSEEDITNPKNPYGHSKLFMEQALKDVRRSDNMDFIILRYFNVAGAASDLSLGPRTVNATHLIKVVAEAAAGKREKVDVFGSDYPTRDGSAIRDFIHIEDLIEAHWVAMKYLKTNSVGEIFNCGYGKGYSVLELLQAMEKVSGKKISRNLSQRRAGDPIEVVANVDKIKTVLGWKPEKDNLELICKSAWEWEKILK